MHPTPPPPPPPPAPPSHADRAAAFLRDIDGGAAAGGVEVDVANLRALARGGLPDEPPRVRATAWKILLGYLPPTPATWPAVLAARRCEYAQLCADFASRAPPPPSVDDHPLSSAPSSAWAAHFRDGELAAQIERDVARTHPDLDCFGGSGPRAVKARAALARSLLVFAKTNPGLAYVQGMHELLAVIYHALDREGDGESGCDGGDGDGDGSAAAAEADAFFCLVALMADFRDNFCAALDDSSGGVRASLAALAAAVRSADPRLAAHVFDANGVDPAFFGFRWTTLLLTQEFALPDATVLWDALLAEAGPDRPAALRRVCAAMVVAARDALLAGDFAANVKLLQDYPSADVRGLLARAAALEGR